MQNTRSSLRMPSFRVAVSATQKESGRIGIGADEATGSSLMRLPETLLNISDGDRPNANRPNEEE
jgi:hypothetical protein